MKKNKTRLSNAIYTLATCLFLTCIPTAGWAFGEPDVQLNNYTEGEDAVIQGMAVSMGGSNEFVECFCWGAVVEGGSGAVVELVGDGVEVWLVAGDGGSFG